MDSVLIISGNRSICLVSISLFLFGYVSGLHQICRRMGTAAYCQVRRLTIYWFSGKLALDTFWSGSGTTPGLARYSAAFFYFISQLARYALSYPYGKSFDFVIEIFIQGKRRQLYQG